MKPTRDELLQQLALTERELDRAREVIAQLHRERRGEHRLMLTDKQPCKRLYVTSRANIAQ